MTLAAAYSRNGTGRARTLSLLAILSTSSCYLFCPDDFSEHVPNPPVANVEILPDTVWVENLRKFTLNVRLRDSDGHVLSDARASSVLWEVGRNGGISSPIPQADTAALSTNWTGVLPHETSVIAKIAGVADTTIITLVSGPTGSDDWIVSDHVTGEPPRIALLDGTVLVGASKVWASDSTIAFVEQASLGKFLAGAFGGNSGEVTVFSRNRRISRYSSVWADPFDRVYLAGVASEFDPPPASDKVHTLLGLPVTIKVVIWNFDDAASDDRIVEDMENARKIFVRARTGIEFAVTYKRWRGVHTDINLIDPCPPTGPYNVRQQLNDFEVDSYATDVITVVYVRETHDALSPIDGPNGQACLWNGADGAIVIVASRRRINSTLAHELGHALGAPPPVFRHTFEGDGFDESNLMWPNTAAVPASRVRLSLGQAFRLSLARGSFADTIALNAGVVCSPTATSDVPCPKLLKDVGRP